MAAERPSILVVDDEQSALVFLTRFLENAGFEVVTATDGRLALERYAERPFDLVLTDLQMPVMDGLELVRELGEREGEPQIFVMTAYATVGWWSEIISTYRNGHRR